MTKKSLTSIVDELIDLDPTLKKHRTLLEENIGAILSAKPDTKFTTAFKKKLLVQLQQHINRTPVAHSTPSPLFVMQKLLYALSGAAVASVALYITVLSPQPIAYKEEHMPTQAMPMVPPAENDAVGMEADMAEEVSVHSMKVTGRGGGGVMMDMPMIEPEGPYGYPSFQYVYDGNIPLPEESTVKGYKRLPLQKGQKADVLRGTFVEDMLDVTKLSSLHITQVSLSEDGDEPLVVNIDFNDGSININRQINHKKMPTYECGDENCWERNRLKKSDMLPEDRTVQIATDFLTDLGINTARYGEPSIQDDWSVQYALTPDKANFYFPEQVSVTFPYLVNGVPVFDEWGNPNGVSVSIDIRLRAATGVWGLRTMQFEEQSYDAVTDPELIREAMAMGEIHGYIPEDDGREEVQLAKPQMVYMQKHHWNDDMRIGYEVYVPALAFPIKHIPGGNFTHRKAVVVPLATSFLPTQDQHMPPMPIPLPMPVEPMEYMEGES